MKKTATQKELDHALQIEDFQKAGQLEKELVEVEKCIRMNLVTPSPPSLSPKEAETVEYMRKTLQEEINRAWNMENFDKVEELGPGSPGPCR